VIPPRRRVRRCVFLARTVSIALVLSSLAGCGAQPEPKPRWVTTIGHSVLTHPILAGDVLFAEAGDSLYALVASSGASRWQRRRLGASLLGRAVVADGLVYVTGDRLFALDGASGGTRWTWSFPPDVKATGDPAVAGGLVYVAADDTNRIYVLEAQTGALRTILHVATARTFYRSAVTVSAGSIMVAVWPDAGVHAFDAATGALRWSAATPGDHESDAVVVDGAVYVTTTRTAVHCIDVTTGAERWTAAVGGQAANFSSPTVANGVVYVSHDDRHVHALSASTGARLWTATTGANVEGSPAIADGVVYAGADDGMLYAFDAARGTLRGVTHPGGIVGTAPVVSHGVVYAGTLDGKVYAYDAASFR
jgi:outer membrane protein assembly factor BamB